MPDSFKGRNVGGYVIEDRIGQGAMATVYSAFEQSIDRHVAMKIIEIDESQQDEFRKRFEREAQFIAKLEHIHILPIYGYGIDNQTDDEIAYLAMRWLKGGSLSDLLKHGPIPMEQTVKIFNQVAEGLAYAHSKGIIHRDLKPSNIMLDDRGNAYLTDFGLAKLTEQSGEITRSGTIVGTPAYMSPEQLRGESLDHRSDIYSLGVILYNMVTGRLPFESTSNEFISIIYQHLEKPPPPPREFKPDIPQSVEDVVLKALKKDRKDRYDNAIEMAQALNVALGLPAGSMINLPPAPPIDFSKTQSFSALSSKIFKNRKRSALMGGVALLLLILIAAFIIIRKNMPVSFGKILSGETAALDAIVPSDDEISQAIKSVGDEGFLAYLTCSTDSEFHAGMARELSDLANKYGMPYKLYDSENDKAKQIPAFETARAEGAKAIIICPLDPNILLPSMKSASAAKVPMVVFASDMANSGAVMVGGNDYTLGLEPGRFAGKIIRDEKEGNANVIILDYPRKDLQDRAQGLEDGLKEFAPNANIIGRYTGGTSDDGKASVEKLIKDGVKFDFILSINDAGSFGAIDAMEEAGIDPSAVTIISIDAEELAKEYISKGYYMRASVESAREALADAMFDAMVKLLSGHDVPETIDVPPKEIVTKETLAMTATASLATATP